MRAAFLHVAHKTIARTARHNQPDAIKRMRAIVLEVLRQLHLGQLHPPGLRQRLPRMAAHCAKHSLLRLMARYPSKKARTVSRPGFL